MKRRHVISLLVVLQLCAIAGYLLVEKSRTDEARRARVTNTTPPRPVDQRVAALLAERRDGSAIDIAAFDQPTIVHVWGTWCPPCLDELPEIARWATRSEIPLVAVALDHDWGPIDEFTQTIPVLDVLRGDAAAWEKELELSTVPATFLIEPGGEVRLRADGARDWRDRDFTARWRVVD